MKWRKEGERKKDREGERGKGGERGRGVGRRGGGGLGEKTGREEEGGWVLVRGEGEGEVCGMLCMCNYYCWFVL